MLSVIDVSAGYGAENILEGLSLTVEAGEIVSLLGPSGCGKSTLLRAIAGFEDLRQGRIEVKGKTLSSVEHTVPCEQRSTGMVFQDYALFPHMNIAQNLAFGLKDQKASAQQARIKHLAEVTGIEAFLKRYPHELSGGQQQRVALARALAPAPDLLLLDEPFSNLDAELRSSLNADVRNILKQEGVTGLLVTHDQHEAFTFADRIALMEQGEIVQIDQAHRIYSHPATPFVAEFVGSGRWMSGRKLSGPKAETCFGEVDIHSSTHIDENADVRLMVRAEDVVLDPSSQVTGRITHQTYKGSRTLYTLEVDALTKLMALLPATPHLNVGSIVPVRIAPRPLPCFPSC